MQEKFSNILVKFLWQFVIVLGIGMSAYSQATDQYSSDHSIVAFQNEGLDLSTFQFLADDDSHIPSHNSPAEEPSSNEENGEEEENEENSDSDNDGELSHYQVESLLDPFTNSEASVEISINHGSYKIPLYILFHCWKSFIS
jgi:hypothetical protein